MTKAEKWRIVTRIGAFTAPPGAVLGVVLGYFLGGGGVRSMASGALIGFLISIGMVAFEVSWAVGLIPRRWREAPFLVVLFTRSLVWLGIIVFGISSPLLTVAQVPLDEVVDPTFTATVLVTLVAALVGNFVGQVNRLLGRGVLVRLILGRYHRPREETRIFLLVDLKGSTQIAERLGNLRYHTFLKRFIDDATYSAERHGAEVHRYVGDEVIFTWIERKGVADAACVRAVFAIVDAFDAVADEYVDAFGVVPTIWAGLHLGTVVTGDIGSVKHEIAYLGDTLNTAARIEQACREFQRPFLASADVIAAVELPPDVETENLGPIDLRGKRTSVELLAVARHS
jgi:adenylate cyclase